MIVKLMVIAIVVVGLGVGGVILGVPSVKEKLFPKNELAVTEEEQRALDAPAAQAKNEEEEEVVYTSKEIGTLAAKLEKKEMQLKLKEENLQIRIDRFEGREDQVIRRQREVEEMLRTVAQYIPLITEAEKKNIKKLAKMFETLSPENANPLIAQMQDDTVVNVLINMKPRNSASIIGNYASLGPANAKRAALLTEKLKKFVIK